MSIDVCVSPKNAGVENKKCDPLKKGLNFRVGVFFDGTLNNKYNTKKGPGFNSSGSYQNDESNIARLYEKYDVKQTSESIACLKEYIIGVGTETGKSDYHISTGTGMARGGMIHQNLRACRQIAKSIVEYIDDKGLESGTKINSIVFDVFGFSRGAATARHFVNELAMKKAKDVYEDGDEFEVEIGGILGHFLKTENLSKHRMEQSVKYSLLRPSVSITEVRGISKLQLSVNFLGLFDTVCAYGTADDGDNEGINLSLKQTYINKVFHIVAEDEHRTNFRLNHIVSAGDRGLTLRMPGVHSDIGGGYKDNYREDIILRPRSGLGGDKMIDLYEEDRSF
ncbi:MAG: DUF2235 domain-containing protein [Chitinophagales bacterium]